jgi:hypothetical protein
MTFASAVPVNSNPSLMGAPAWFDPYKKYPAPPGAPTHWNFTGQGVHYQRAHAASMRAVEILGGSLDKVSSYEI